MGKGLESLIDKDQLVGFATDDVVLEALIFALEHGDRPREDRCKIMNYIKNIQLWKLYLSQSCSCGTSCSDSRLKICKMK